MSDSDAFNERFSAWLGAHPTWTFDAVRRVLRRVLVFEDFTTAFGFMTVVAIRAQELNHHPDWSNSYHQVAIELTTHSAGTVTDTDLELATFVDEWAERCGVKPAQLPEPHGRL